MYRARPECSNWICRFVQTGRYDLYKHQILKGKFYGEKIAGIAVGKFVFYEKQIFRRPRNIKGIKKRRFRPFYQYKRRQWA